MSAAGKTDIRNRVAGSASSTGRHACGEAVDGAISALGGEAGLVLIFSSGDVDPHAAAGEAQEAAGDALVAGMTGTGVIDAHGLLKCGCTAIAFSSSLSVGIGAAEAGESAAAGRDASADALAAIHDAPHRVVLLLVDSESGDQAEFVAGAYGVAGAAIPLAGGAAGGLERTRFVNGRALASGVVGVAIGSRAPIGVGVAHGCVVRGAPSIVTRSQGPNVIQLDGRPAEAVYLEKLGVDGVDLDDAEFETLAMVHPLAEPELSGAIRPRYVRARASDGTLVCATSMERNAAVAVCDQTPRAIIQSARAAVEDAVSQLQRQAEAALVFDCAARSAWFRGPLHEALAQRELDSISAAFGEPTPALAGVYTRGEIGRARGAKGDRNHSVVVVAFDTAD
jgi:hypothetical protein